MHGCISELHNKTLKSNQCNNWLVFLFFWINFSSFSIKVFVFYCFMLLWFFFPHQCIHSNPFFWHNFYSFLVFAQCFDFAPISTITCLYGILRSRKLNNWLKVQSTTWYSKKIMICDMMTICGSNIFGSHLNKETKTYYGGKKHKFSIYNPYKYLCGL